ncbi:hypothetical protein PGTUg99_015720 [Puccinia graminis f. sp. tritici]|uniref:ATP-dependent DNA helicase sgs1 n=1 Tax=Puccinia graminis f. sp. tritici TaxID=56615 RepID=A0A5B0Q0W6_PUCGR|nr:hypothetical protein PGTUg99_015720 [Puccinia graminis f. sp. tritici]
MDALAVTPVCLRVAFAVDNLVGHVPLSFDDPAYKVEVAREKKENFPPCMCSNCMGDMGKLLVQNLKNVNQTNFSDYILNKVLMDPNGSGTAHSNKSDGTGVKQTIENPIKLKKEEQTVLKEMLKRDCHDFITKTVGKGGTIVPGRFFGDSKAQAIVRNINQIVDASDMQRIIKGKAFWGQVKLLMTTVERFKVEKHMPIELESVAFKRPRIVTEVTNGQTLDVTKKQLDVNNRQMKVKTGSESVRVLEHTSLPVKKKRCSRQEAQAKMAEEAERKRIRKESKNQRDAKPAESKRIQKEGQQQIINEVKQAYVMNKKTSDIG